MSTHHPKIHQPEVVPVSADSDNATARLRRAVIGAREPRALDDSKSVVLLVDDQLMIGEALRRSLADEPNIVFHFCSEPGAAIATAERMAPTVILQDLVMPGIEGLTLVREYRALEATRHTPIIVLSYAGRPCDQARCVRGGRERLLGEVAGQDRIDCADPLSLAGFFKPAAARCGLRGLA